MRLFYRNLFAVLAFVSFLLGIWWNPKAMWGVLVFGSASRLAAKRAAEKAAAGL